MEKEKLIEICLKHNNWLNEKDGGERASLSGADLSRASLSGANLSGADLSRASLSGANLYGANLSGADLSGADLYGAELYGANLSGANLSRVRLPRANLYGADLSGACLSGANLYGANLSGADLSGASLSGADLYGTDLYGADLYGANLSGADLSRADLSRANNAEHVQAQTCVVPEGSIIGWKKARTEDGEFCIVKLRIPEEAKRSNASGRKCRAEFADVIEVIGADFAVSEYDRNLVYRPGERVTPDFFDENRWKECANGIHFFITRIEAERYDL